MNILEKLTALEKEAEIFGFKWETPHQILEQIKSECVEIDEHLGEANSKEKLQEEIGDLLHAAFSLCIFSGFSPQETLENSVNKFERRFKRVKLLAEENGLKTLNGLSFDQLMEFWDKAKKIESGGPT